MSKPLIILASASPRRRELLHQIGIPYEVIPADILEEPATDEAPQAYVQRIAAEKSQEILNIGNIDLPVLAADTEVVLENAILGKPRDADHARTLLTQLSGREHQVLSAVSLRVGLHHWSAMSTSTVRFKVLTAAEISAYWETGEPEGKAGAYAIQGLGAMFITHLTGSYSGVMGLPIQETSELLANIGLHPLLHNAKA